MKKIALAVDRRVLGMVWHTDGWEDIKRRYECWWRGELYDRALVQVTAPRDGAPPALPWRGGRATPEEKWTDIDFAIWCTEQRLARIWWGGDAIPTLDSYISPVGMSGGGGVLLGCRPTYAEDTVWVEPLRHDDGLPEIRMDATWHKRILSSIEKASRASRGRWFMRESFANQAGDSLALVRGTERLLEDLVERPDWVARAVRGVSQIIRRVDRELWDRVSPDLTGMDGYASTAGIWSSSVNLCTDCDFSCMISPRQFREIFLPPLVEHMRDCPLNIYHLDGTEAIRHLDALLEVDCLRAIQWIPGAGREAILQWVPLLRRVLDTGRSVQILVQPEEVEPLLAELPSRGLLLSTSCRSESEGRDLVRLVERCSR